MTREYIAYLSSTHFSGGEEVLRVTAQGEFIWHERADELIAAKDAAMAAERAEQEKEFRRVFCSVIPQQEHV